MTGLWYEEMHEGAEFRHAFSRTVTEMDNILFTSITMNMAPVHLDEEYCKVNIPQGQRLMNSLYTAGLIGGMIVMDLTFGTTIGNLGYEKMTFPNPVFHGDTLRAETTILDKRESKSRPNAGIVWFEHRGYNQHNDLVHMAHRSGMILKRPGQVASPTTAAMGHG
jgi:acyl dehydratase